MPRLHAANQAKTTLAQNIDALATFFDVADASLFPSPPFRITVLDSNGNPAEIMEVGAVSGNTFSNVQRGLEGTTPTSHNSGAYVENRLTAGMFNEPFYLKSVTYDSANDRIVCTFGAGVAELFNGNARVIVEINDDATYYIDAPATNTTYYLFLQADGTVTHNTSGIVPAGAVLLWQVAVGATKDDLSKIDRRYQISGVGAALAAHLADNVAHDILSHFDPTTGHKHTGAAGDGPQIDPSAFNTASWPAFRAYQSTAQSLAAATWTKIAYQTEVYDQGGIYDNTTYTFTAPASGFYLVSAFIGFAVSVDSTNRIIAAYVNGTVHTRLGQDVVGAALASAVGGSDVIKLNAGDVVEIYAFTKDAGDTYPGSEQSYFSVIRIA